jgi:hypothetical protein
VLKDLEAFVSSFSADPHIHVFAQVFCMTVSETSQFFSSILYECLSMDKPDILEAYLQLSQLLTDPHPLTIEQLDVMQSFYLKMNPEKPLIQAFFRTFINYALKSHLTPGQRSLYQRSESLQLLQSDVLVQSEPLSLLLESFE